MTPHGPTFPIDRSAALLAAVWRGGMAAAFAIPAGLLFRAIDWSLTARTDPFSACAFGTLLALLLLAALTAALSALRRLLLAGWPGPLGATLTPREIALRFGPFGSCRLDTRRLRWVDSAADDDDAVEDDESLPQLLHPEAAGDLVAVIQRFCKTAPADLRRALLDWRRGLSP